MQLLKQKQHFWVDVHSRWVTRNRHPKKSWWAEQAWQWSQHSIGGLGFGHCLLESALQPSYQHLRFYGPAQNKLCSVEPARAGFYCMWPRHGWSHSWESILTLYRANIFLIIVPCLPRIPPCGFWLSRHSNQANACFWCISKGNWQR